MPPEEALRLVLESPYTRYPVYRESLDDIVGILHVRDLVSALNDSAIADVELAGLLRPAYVVPETKDLGALLGEFRRTNQHMAIVVDEYGATMGIVTLEDVLEEIVGDIEDEFDLPDESIERIDETTIRIDGTFTIDDFNEQFGTELDTEDFHTVAGIVFGQLGRAGEPGDEVVEGRAAVHRARDERVAHPASRGRVPAVGCRRRRRRGRRVLRRAAPVPRRLDGSPLRHRDFALVLVSTVATALAIEMAFVAIGWQVYAIDGDPLDLGLVGLAMFLPLPLLALPAGHLADRAPTADGARPRDRARRDRRARARSLSHERAPTRCGRSSCSRSRWASHRRSVRRPAARSCRRSSRGRCSCGRSRSGRSRSRRR